MEQFEIHDKVFDIGLRLKSFRWDKLSADIGGTGFHMLGILEKYKHTNPNQIGVYASVIADILNISRPAVSRQLQQMEDAGWIVRLTDPKSKRNIFVKLLPEGERVYNEQKGKMIEFWKNVCERMGEEQVQQMIDGLNGFIDAAQTELDIIESKRKGEHK